MATTFKWKAPTSSRNVKLVTTFVPDECGFNPIVQMADLGQGTNIQTRKNQSDDNWIGFHIDSTWRQRELLKSSEGLVRKFARDKPILETAIRLAQEFGPLGRFIHSGQVEVSEQFCPNPLYRSSDAKPQAMSRPVWEIVRNVQMGEMRIVAEPLKNWIFELRKLRILDRLVSALELGPTAQENALNKIFNYHAFVNAYDPSSKRLDNTKRVKPKEGRIDDDDLLISIFRLEDLELPHDFEFELHLEQAVTLAGNAAEKKSRSIPTLRELAQGVVRNWINFQLWEGCAITLLGGEFGDGAFYRYPRDLLGAVYVSLADKYMLGLTQLRKCPECGRNFAPKRADQVFCNLQATQDFEEPEVPSRNCYQRWKKRSQRAVKKQTTAPE